MVPTLLDRSWKRRLVAQIGTILLLAPACMADEAPPDTSLAPLNVSPGRSAADDALENLLDQKVSTEQAEEELSGLVDLLRNHKVDTILDVRALEEAGLNSDSPLRIPKVSNISLRSLLEILMRAASLDYLVRDGKLLVTTTDVADNELQSIIYRVDDLVRTKNAAGQEVDDYSSLVDLIETTVMPSSWDEVGGPATIGTFQGLLLVSQTQRVHRKILDFLEALRESRAKQAASVTAEPIWVESAANAAVRREFAEKSEALLDLSFDRQPLAEVAAAIGERLEMPVVLDSRALEEAGNGSDTPITCDLRQITLPAGLTMLLRSVGLTWALQDEVVLITTEDQADNFICTVVYPVADLVRYGAPKVDAARQDFDPLIRLITQTVKPDSWDEVGGPGTIGESRRTSSLAVGQTQEVHAEIAPLISGLRKLHRPLPSGDQTARLSCAARNDSVGDDTDIITKTYVLTPQADPAALVTLLRSIDESSWEHDGAQVRASGGQLIVRNTRAVQRQVEARLSNAKALAPRGGGRGGVGGGMGGGMMGGMGGGMF